MSCENCKSEKHDIHLSAESGRIMADVMQEKNRLLRICCGLIVALSIAFVIMAFCMVWAVQNAQAVANEAMKEALATVSEIGVVEETTTTTTTTQSVDGDNATINNGEWEQYNDTATKNEYQTGDQNGPEGE